MTLTELKSNVDNTGSKFFSRGSLKFLGDSLRNYGVRSGVVDSEYGEDRKYMGAGNTRTVDAWELYRKSPVKNGLTNSTYFDKKNFQVVFTIKG